MGTTFPIPPNVAMKLALNQGLKTEYVKYCMYANMVASVTEHTNHPDVLKIAINEAAQENGLFDRFFSVVPTIFMYNSRGSVKPAQKVTAELKAWVAKYADGFNVEGDEMPLAKFLFTDTFPRICVSAMCTIDIQYRGMLKMIERNAPDNNQLEILEFLRNEELVPALESTKHRMLQIFQEKDMLFDSKMSRQLSDAFSNHAQALMYAPKDLIKLCLQRLASEFNVDFREDVESGRPYDMAYIMAVAETDLDADKFIEKLENELKGGADDA